MSLAQLSAWCSERFGPREVRAEHTRRKWDVPWLVMDSYTHCRTASGGRRAGASLGILDEIAEHHRSHPGWLTLTDRG